LSSEHQLSELLSSSIPSSSCDIDNQSNPMFNNAATTTTTHNRPPMNLLKLIFEPTFASFPDNINNVKQENDVCSSPKEQPNSTFAIDRNEVSKMQSKEPPKQRPEENVEQVSSSSFVTDTYSGKKRHSGSSSSSSSSSYYRKRKRKKRERKEKDNGKKRHKYSKSSKKKKKRSKA